MKPKITVVDSCKLKIAAFECEAVGKVSQKTIDPTPYAGQYIRIWLEKDGTYSLDAKRDHYWQVAELQVPAQQYTQVDTGETDSDTGEPIMRTEALPLDLSAVEIFIWDLPQ